MCSFEITCVQSLVAHCDAKHCTKCSPPLLSGFLLSCKSSCFDAAWVTLLGCLLYCSCCHNRVRVLRVSGRPLSTDCVTVSWYASLLLTSVRPWSS